MKPIPLLLVMMSVCAISLAQTPPSNDLCANPIPVFDGVNPNAPAGISGSTFTSVGAGTDGATNCAYSSYQPTHHDVWFTYVATATGTARMATCTPPGFTAGTGGAMLSVFASCGGVELACFANGYCDNQKAQLGVNVTAGASYLIRVASLVQQQPGTFYLTIAPPGPPPANDTCANAIPVFDGINPAAPGASFTNVDATPDVTTCNLGEPDVWFAYTATTSGVTTITSASAGSSPYVFPNLSIFASCGVLALVCHAYGAVGPTIPVAAGTTYLIRASSDIALTGPFTLSITTPVPAPPNDDCAGALPLSLGSNGPFTNAGASISLPSTDGRRDLWYSFTTGACPGSYTVDLCPEMAWMYLAVYTACNGQLAGAGGPLFGFVCGRATFTAAPFTSYVVRVFGPENLSYGVNITQGAAATLSFSSPGGPTCVQADLSGIPSNGLYFFAVTQNAGAFPYGALYGIDIPYSELVAEASAGYPFAGSADACGNAQLGPYCGLPSGLTLYAVAFGFSGGYSLTPARYTGPLSYTIP